MYPRQSSTTHTEQLGHEASVYDWARAQVHALNPTAACVWRLCDGATSPEAIAAALRREMGIPEAEAVVDLTLRQLARVHLLELPVESGSDRPAMTRRWLLGRGVAAAMLPAIYSIVAPSPVEAQTPGAPAAPTLTNVSPNQGIRGVTVAVTLTGTNFVVGATTVNVSGGGVTVNNVVVTSGTSLTANFVLDLAAAGGARTVTVTTAGGTSGGQTFTITLPSSGSVTFDFTGAAQTFTVPAGVSSVTILATGGGGAAGTSGAGGLGGRTTATVSVTPGTSLTVLVGGAGVTGGFNGGGSGNGFGAGNGGGASSVRNGATPLVIVGGGGGGAAGPLPDSDGGAGGDLAGAPGVTLPLGGVGGGGGTDVAGGAGGTGAVGGGGSGTDGVANQGGNGGIGGSIGVGGGGGGGGYYGGGGGGGGIAGVAGGGGGGGSSFAAPGATGVLHEQGVKAANGSVTISW